MPEERPPQIRSYHRAYNYERIMYGVGDITFWWPIPVRGVLWVGGIEVVLALLTRILGLHFPFLSSFGWWMVFGVFPVALGYLLAVSKIEGRRLHVALEALVRHGFRGDHLVGGHRQLYMEEGLKLGRVRVRNRE